MKQINKKCLELLKEKDINNYKDIIETSINYSKNKLFSEAKKLLLSTNKTIDKKGIINIKKSDTPFLLLKGISKYLYYISLSENESQLKQETKKFSKTIKTIYIYLMNHFDESFLLFKNDSNIITTFSAIDNSYFLNIADELVTLLNSINYTKEADNFFMLKSKIELGFERYFYHKNENILIKEFNTDGKYKIAVLNDLLIILNNHNPNTNLIKTISKKEIKENYSNYLLYLNLLKKTDNKKFKEEFSKNKKEITLLPQLVLSLKEFSIFEKLSKSIKSDIIILNKKINSKILTNLNTIIIINLTLNLTKNE